MELVAFLGKDKENLGQITALINKGEWEKILLLKNKDTPNIQTTKQYKTLTINNSLPLFELKEEMKETSFRLYCQFRLELKSWLSRRRGLSF
ncbi:hypothetical protein J4462_02520 [Candidatus Pacearchaeota archaeon]|nr:hypothetical protein [Candidatus Pacearchaeota archaeon]